MGENSGFLVPLKGHIHREIRNFLTIPDNLILCQTCHKLYNNFGEGNIFYVLLNFEHKKLGIFKAWPMFESFDEFTVRTQYPITLTISGFKEQIWNCYQEEEEDYYVCTKEPNKAELKFDENQFKTFGTITIQLLNFSLVIMVCL